MRRFCFITIACLAFAISISLGTDVSATDHSAMLGNYVSPAGPPPPVDLPTVPPHAAPPYVWHHDLTAPGAGSTVPLAAGGGTTGPLGFVDALAALPWHMESELEGMGAGNGPGNLVVWVVGQGGWIFPYPASAPGATFTVAFPAPPHDSNEIVYPEVPEVGAWTITYTNNTPALIGMDGSVVETDDPDGNQPPTPFDLEGDPPDTMDVLITIGQERVPSVTNWGLIILALLLVVSAVYVIYRRRQVAQV